MKTITPFLLKFVAVAIIITIIFRLLLSYGIDEHNEIIVIIAPIFIFIGMFFAGWYFGKKDGEYLPIYDIGFRFHLATYVVFNVISELWFLFNFQSKYENIKLIHYIVLIWGVFLLVHFVFYLIVKKKSINDLDKTDLFE